MRKTRKAGQFSGGGKWQGMKKLGMIVNAHKPGAVAMARRLLQWGRDRGLSFTLRIVGQGPARAGLRRLARQRGLTNLVEFPGQIPHENMAEMYAAADIFVAPGREHPRDRTDGLPSALTEAQAFGLAVVASNLPAQTEAVQDGGNGRLVPQEDAPALAAVLEELMARPEERRRLGEAARASVGELTDEEGARARLRDLFLQACRKPSGASPDAQS